MSDRSALALLAVVLLTAPLLLPAAASAQRRPASDPGREAGSAARGAWFPEDVSFRPLTAAPREVGLRGSLVVADRPDLASDFAGENVESEVALGHRIPVLRLAEESRSGLSLTLGFEAGVFARFFLASSARDLLNTDFRAGLPLSFSRGGWEARLTLLHESSHLGDDFLRRFGRPPASRPSEEELDQVTRDGLELLVARRVLPDVRLYAGGSWNFHTNARVEGSEARAGAEWLPDGDEASGLRPFAAVDLALDERTDELAATGAAGLGLRVGSVRLRLTARAHTGPSPMGWFREVDEQFAGLGLRVEL